MRQFGKGSVSGYVFVTIILVIGLLSACGGGGGNNAGANNAGGGGGALDSTPPSVPSSLAAAAASASQIVLSWTAATDNLGVQGYKIYRNGQYIGNASVSSYTDSAVTGATTYCYTVIAFDSAFNESAPSAQICVTTPPGTGTDTQSPTQPSAPAGYAVSETQIDVSWSAGSDNIGVTGYILYRNQPSALKANLVAAAVTEVTNTANTSYSDTGLTSNTEYCYSVAAYDAAGNVSAPSDETCLRTLAPDSTAPYVVITSPSGSDWVSTKSASIALGGLASDDRSLALVEWSQDGKAVSDPTKTWTATTGTTNWSVATVNLSAGDNTIDARATDAAGYTTTDTMVVTLNSSVQFDSSPYVSPDYLKKGEATDVVFKISVEDLANITSVGVYKVDASNNPTTLVTLLYDDGNFQNHYDDLQNDDVWTMKLELNEGVAGEIPLRVQVLLSNGTKALSEVFYIWVVDTSQTSSLQKAISLSKEGTLYYTSLLIQYGDPLLAKQLFFQWLDAQSGVAQSGESIAGEGVWFVTTGGVLGGSLLHSASQRGGGRDVVYEGPPTERESLINTPLMKGKPFSLLSGQSKKKSFYGYPAQTGLFGKNFLLLGPYNTTYNVTSELLSLPQVTIDGGCPGFNTLTVYDSSATVDAFKNFEVFGALASIVSKGDVMFNGIDSTYADYFGWNPDIGQVVILTGEAATISGMEKRYGDLLRGRLAIINGVYAVLPSFITYYNKNLTNSVVHAGSCNSLFNETMAGAFIGAGAKTYTGYDGYVESSYARDSALSYWKNFMAGNTTGDSFTNAVNEVGANDGKTVNAAFFAQSGDATIVKSTVPDGIFNGDFEYGSLVGWYSDSDVRVLRSLGINGGLPYLTPPGGSFMSIVSTGVGSGGSDSNTFSSMQQAFCVPAGMTTLTLSYNVMSEEWTEYSCSQFNDNVKAVLTLPDDTEVSLFHEYVNKYCIDENNSAVNRPALDYSGFIDFPGGDASVYATGWQTITYDVTQYAGTEQLLIMKLNAWDEADSIFDSAGLLDDIGLQ